MSFFKNLFNTAEPEEKVEMQIDEPIQTSPVVDDKASPNLLCVEPAQIHLQQTFSNKQDVLVFIAQQMSALGFVNGDYLNALVERENKISTYLVNGVAIPHGINEAKSQVNKTGVIIVQIPEGIIWNEQGDLAKLIVGIAAANDDHLTLLQKLTAVVMDADLSESLAKTSDANSIIKALGAKSKSQTLTQEDFEITAQATVVDEAGMHARPASLLAEQAGLYTETEVRLRNGDRSVNAKSMAALLTMGAQQGDSLTVSAQGLQAEEAVQALSELINAGLDSDDDNENASYNPLAGLPALTSPAGDLVLNGLAASPGIAVANSYLLKKITREIKQTSKRSKSRIRCITTSAANRHIRNRGVVSNTISQGP